MNIHEIHEYCFMIRYEYMGHDEMGRIDHPKFAQCTHHHHYSNNSMQYHI